MPGKESTAFIGTGEIAKIHAPCLYNHHVLELSAIVEPDEQQQNTFLSHLQKTGWDVSAIRRFRNYEEILQDGSIHAVYVLTPPVVTPVIAATCLRAGKQVFCEKPMGVPTNPTDVDDLVAAAAASDRVAITDFIYHAEKSFRQMRSWLKEGRIGGPRIYKFEKFNEPFANLDILRRFNENYLRHGAGPLFTSGSHYMYLLLEFARLSGTNIKSAYCWRKNLDPGNFAGPNHEYGFFFFGNDDIGEIEIQWLAPVPERAAKEASPLLYEAVVTGNGGVIKYHADDGFVDLYDRKHDLLANGGGKKGRYQFMTDSFAHAIDPSFRPREDDPSFPTLDPDFPVPGIREGKAVYDLGLQAYAHEIKG